MTETLTGGCVCGAVRYEVKPGFRMKPYACHCTDCQKRTGSAFGVQMGIVESDLILLGELITGTFRQPSGVVATYYACTKCLSKIYVLNSERPGFANIRAGSLDNSSDLNPVVHFWTRSKQLWIAIPEGVPTLETQPQSSEEWLKYVGPE